MLWIKALHVIFIATRFAGLFYLPRLFVYRAMSDDAAGIERFTVTATVIPVVVRPF